jgi:hypothetical protein
MKIEFESEFKSIFDSIAKRYEVTYAIKVATHKLCEEGKRDEVEARSMDDIDILSN